MSSRMTLLYAFATIVVAAFFIVALSVHADAATSEPPFEVRFPQETSSTEFSATFGARRSGGRRHKGNDLMAPKMTEVYAMADGVVERVAASGTAGRYLVIAHADGWSSTYMHLNNDTPNTDNGSAEWEDTLAIGIEEGTEIHAGQLIGYVGDSGNAEWTGSHTHFELRLNGRAVNPYPILEKAWSRDYLRHVWNLWRIYEKLDLDSMV